MPLLALTLERGLMEMQQRPPRTPVDTAERLATAYFQYAQAGTANGIPPVFTGAERLRMTKALLPALMNPHSGSLPALASALASSLLAFWTGVVFGVGAFTVLTAPVCSNAILASCQGSLPAARAAKALARSMDSATKTAVITFPPPVGPVPLI